MKVKVSAPGKVTLFGEHAVVYGKPAVVTSISRRVYVTVEPRSDDTVRINALDLKIPGVILSFREDVGEITLETDYGRVISALSYVRKALDVASEHLGVRRGVNITITSSMPVGAGLGTSAAVSVATIYGYAQALGYEMEKGEVARLGHRVELEVQGAASPMDTAIASYGGTLLIEPEGESGPRISPISAPELPIVVGYVEREATTKELVAKVRTLRNRWRGIVDRILDGIEAVTREAISALKRSNLEELGELMNVNHGLLDSLGVSTDRLNRMVYASREAGALGAKLTGAGGGGCMIALAPGRTGEVEAAIKVSGGSPLTVSTGVEGVRVERDGAE